MTQPASPVASKRARILRRTLFGGGLALMCAGVLWLAHAIGSATPVLWIGAMIALLGLVEASMMGTLVLRSLPVILIMPLVGVALIEFACIAHQQPTAPWEQLLLEVGFAASLTVMVHALTRSLARRERTRQLLILGLCALLAVLFAWLEAHDRGPLDALPTFGIIGAAAVVIALFVYRSSNRLVDLGIAVSLVLWIAVPLPAAAQVWRLWGVSGLISLIVLSKIGDVAGYYVGSAIGRRRPFPKLSPNKTVAGFVSSFVAAVIAGAVLARCGMLPDGSQGLLGGVIAGAAINLASQSGDLFESWVKRRVRVKDSSTWLGPSGGVLDVVDSLLFSIPTALVAWPLIFEA